MTTTCDRQYCTIFDNQGLHDTNRNVSTCVVLPKVAKASRLIKYLCVTTVTDIFTIKVLPNFMLNVYVTNFIFIQENEPKVQTKNISLHSPWSKL